MVENKMGFESIPTGTEKVLVVDDELIGSRAQDVELKSLSYRKADKEGPVADCVADSILGIMFGSRLRIRSEPEKINVEKLLWEAHLH